VLSRRLSIGLIAISLLAAGCTLADSSSSPPISVSSAVAEGSGVTTELRIGMVLNISAPTAERDEQVRDVLDAAIRASPAAANSRLETVQIDEADDIDAAVVALRGLGVTVLVTTCDDGTVPSVVDAGLDNQMLVLSGCATIPRPELSIDSDLFIDVGTLTTSPAATVAGLHEMLGDDGQWNVATIASDLVPDVAGECSAIEDALSPAQLHSSGRFTGLIDDSAVTVAALDETAAEVDAFVLCALAPTVGDLSTALRNSGFEQPIVVPWFSDDQTWPGETNDVWIVAPSSRYGDDPVGEVNELYDIVDDSGSTDIVAADTLSILVNAVGRIGSVSPARLAEVLREAPSTGLGGELTLRPSGQVERTYRLLEVIDGEPEFASSIQAQ